PDKLLTDEVDRSEGAYFVRKYNLRANVDFIPSYGVAIGYFGPFGHLVVMALFGVMLALIDRWLVARNTPARSLVAAGVLLSALYYERGVDGFTTTMRGVLLLGFLLWLLDQLRRRPLSRPPRRAHQHA